MLKRLCPPITKTSSVLASSCISSTDLITLMLSDSWILLPEVRITFFLLGRGRTLSGSEFHVFLPMTTVLPVVISRNRLRSSGICQGSLLSTPIRKLDVKARITLRDMVVGKVVIKKKKEPSTEGLFHLSVAIAARRPRYSTYPNGSPVTNAIGV